MKRSRSIALVAMGVSSLALSACGENIDTATFQSPDDCRSSGLYAAEQCLTDYDSARGQHRSVAPRYANREDCEADFGSDVCEPADDTSSGGSAASSAAVYRTSSGYYYANSTPYAGPFRPRMSGYMLGASGKSCRIKAQPLYTPVDSGTRAPLGFATADGTSVSTRTGPVRVSSFSVPAAPSAKTGTIARGGFGRAGGSAGG